MANTNLEPAWQSGRVPSPVDLIESASVIVKRFAHGRHVSSTLAIALNRLGKASSIRGQLYIKPSRHYGRETLPDDSLEFASQIV